MRGHAAHDGSDEADGTGGWSRVKILRCRLKAVSLTALIAPLALKPIDRHAGENLAILILANLHEA
jgi:hypothetical protein